MRGADLLVCTPAHLDAKTGRTMGLPVPTTARYRLQRGSKREQALERRLPEEQ